MGNIFFGNRIFLILNVILIYIVLSTSFCKADVREYFEVPYDGYRSKYYTYSKTEYSNMPDKLHESTSYIWVDGQKEISGINCFKHYHSQLGFNKNPYNIGYVAEVNNLIVTLGADVTDASGNVVSTVRYNPYDIQMKLDMNIGDSFAYHYIANIESMYVNATEEGNLTIKIIGKEAITTHYGDYSNTLKYTVTGNKITKASEHTSTSSVNFTCWVSPGKGLVRTISEGDGWKDTADYSDIQREQADQSVMWYWDNDGDGYGTPAISVESVLQPSGYVIDNSDCEDNNGNIHPGATEICGDGIDQDCNGSDTVCESNPALAYEIQKLYIGYLGRAADKAGLNYWVNDIATGVMTMEQLRANLTNEQPEYTDIYGGLTRRQLVSQIYRNLFEREPDADGLNYWVSGGGSIVNADQLIVAFLNAASPADRLVLDNKTTVAMHYTEANLNQ